MTEFAVIDDVEVVHDPAQYDQVTFEEFLTLADGYHAEWVGGKVIFMSPASRLHQRLLLWLAKLLDYYVQNRDLGDVMIAPFAVKLQNSDQGREPDLFFVATENLDRLSETALFGPADLIVEIVSRESMGRDRGAKFMEYEAEGVPEYWILDPVRKQAEFYRLGEEGHYHPVLPVDGVYTSAAVTGFWLRPEWMWQDPLPDEIEILRQLGVL